MATLRWMGAPEAEVRMVESTYEMTTAILVVGEVASRSLMSRLPAPADVHSSTGPQQQEDGGEGCYEETPLCGRHGHGGEWQTGATGDTGGVERLVYQTRAETEPREDGCAAHRPPEARAGHRAGGEETDSTGQFRVPRKGRVRRLREGWVRRRVQAGANAWREQLRE